MKILYLTTHLNIGGITKYLLALSSGLRSRGHGISVAYSKGDMSSKFVELGVDLLQVPVNTKSEANALKLFLSYRKLLAYIKKEKIDILHSQTRVTQVLGCILSRISGIAHVTTCHGFFRRRLSRRLFPCWGEKVIAISSQVRNHLVDDFGVRGQDIALIYHGIEQGRDPGNAPSREARGKFGIGQGPVIGIIARLSEVKGHEYLIKAVAVLVGEFPSLQLAVVGEGRLRKKLEALVESLRLQRNVLFLDNVTDTAEMLSFFDVFAMPSLAEGLGLGVMEAMAAGVAVVGSNVGGIKDLVRDGYNGMLVEPGNHTALAAALRSLLKDRSKRELFAGRSAEFIRDKFPFDKMISKTEEVYRECLEKRS